MLLVDVTIVFAISQLCLSQQSVACVTRSKSVVLQSSNYLQRCKLQCSYIISVLGLILIIIEHTVKVHQNSCANPLCRNNGKFHIYNWN